MGIESTEKLKIKCDNPDCPGTDLSSSDRQGWLFVTYEVYGNPTGSGVFCSAACLGAVAMNPDVEPTFEAPPPETPAAV